MKHHIQHYLILLLCTLLVAGCASGNAGQATPAPYFMAHVDIPKPQTGEAAPSTSQPIPIIPTATYPPSLNANVLNVAVWAPPYLSETMGEALDNSLRSLFVSDESQANIRLEVGEGNVVSQWVFALVAPFSSITQGMSGDELLSLWQGNSTGTPLLMDSNTRDMFTVLWGPAGTNVQVIAKETLLDYAWTHQPALGIVPFEELNPRWKVLPVDGLSPIHKDFDLEGYRLKAPISLDSDPEWVALIQSNFAIPASRCQDPAVGILKHL